MLLLTPQMLPQTAPQLAKLMVAGQNGLSILSLSLRYQLPCMLQGHDHSVDVKECCLLTPLQAAGALYPPLLYRMS